MNILNRNLERDPRSGFSWREARIEAEVGAIAIAMSPLGLVEGGGGPIATVLMAGVGALAIGHGLNQLRNLDEWDRRQRG